MTSTIEPDAAPTPATGAPYRVPTIGEAAEGDEFAGVDEIKGSMCMACGGDGTTRMLTTKIPFFREVILSSFECDDCHWRNNEVRPLCSLDASNRRRAVGEHFLGLCDLCLSRHPRRRRYFALTTAAASCESGLLAGLTFIWVEQDRV